VTSDAASTRFIFARTPYYWNVDPAGNQLPYIDSLQIQRDLDGEVVLVRSIAGEFDYAHGDEIDAAVNYAFLKENEADGNFVIAPTIGQAVTLGVITINYSIEDDVLRDLFNSLDFRIALSIGTDRDFINNILYNGLMIPSQWAPADGPPYHGERDIFKQYASYDPERANALLDALNLKWNADKSVRLRPDGAPLEIVMFMNQGEECQDSVAIGELLKSQWEDTLGIQLVLRPRDADFWVFGEENVEQGVHLACFAMSEEYPSTVGRSEIVVPLGGWPLHGEWGYWLNSDGEEGDEPPDGVKQIFDLARQFQGATDPAGAIDLELQITDLHAENIWAIGFLKQPKDYVLANLHLFSSRMGNLSAPMSKEWNYAGMETWTITDI
jgi:peptide/nickel transport system substrate-binding protein